MSTQYLPFVYGFSGEWTEHPSLVQLLSSFTVRSGPDCTRPVSAGPGLHIPGGPLWAPIIFFIAAMCLSM